MAAQNNIPARDGGAWRACQPKVRVSGAWNACKAGWVRVAGVWQQFYTSVLTAIGADLYNSRSGSGLVSVSTTGFGASGGVAPYTFSYTRLSGDTQTISHPDPASANATFSRTVPAGSSSITTYRMTVTDSASGSAFFDFTAELEAI